MTRVLVPVCLGAALMTVGASPDARAQSSAQPINGPDTVEFKSGALALRGLVWRPAGRGPFPAILFTHGSGRALYAREMASIGPFYASHGYVLFWPYRRGQGLSAGRGEYIVDLMDRAGSTQGPAARSKVMADLLATEQMDDELAALDYLKRTPGVDRTRLAVAGNSFGGILAVFLAERGPGVRAVIASAPAAQTWASSPDIRERLLKAASHAKAPIFFMQAENDYDLSPSRMLSAEMQRAGRAYRVKIFPPFGATTAEGHSFGYFGTDIWRGDVLAFLAENLRKR